MYASGKLKVCSIIVPLAKTSNGAGLRLPSDCIRGCMCAAMGLAATVRSSGAGVGLRRRQAADAGKQQHGTGSGDAEQATHASSNAGKRCRLAADSPLIPVPRAQ